MNSFHIGINSYQTGMNSYQIGMNLYQTKSIILGWSPIAQSRKDRFKKFFHIHVPKFGPEFWVRLKHPNSRINQYQPGMNLYQIGMNLYQIGINSYRFRFSYTGNCDLDLTWNLESWKLIGNLPKKDFRTNYHWDKKFLDNFPLRQKNLGKISIETKNFGKDFHWDKKFWDHFLLRQKTLGQFSIETTNFGKILHWDKKLWNKYQLNQ